MLNGISSGGVPHWSEPFWLDGGQMTDWASAGIARRIKKLFQQLDALHPHNRWDRGFDSAVRHDTARSPVLKPEAVHEAQGVRHAASARQVVRRNVMPVHVCSGIAAQYFAGELFARRIFRPHPQ